MLGEGFDLPELKIAGLHDKHKSEAVTLQFVGRFTRIRTDLGDATVIANIAHDNVAAALQSLYAEDADWNAILSVVGAKLTEREERREANPADIKRRITSAEIERDNNLVSWGSNSDSYSPPRTHNNFNIPALVVSGHRFIDVSSGGLHACGVLTDGKTLCWGHIGRNDHEVVAKATPVLGDQRFHRVSSGSEYTCGINFASQVLCWGRRAGLFISGGTSDFQSLPIPVPIDGKIVELSAGITHACAVRDDGKAFCWGDGKNGELGNGLLEKRLTPTPVAGDFKFKQISAGVSHTCAITVENRAVCWGLGTSGALGSGRFQNSATPVMVDDQSEFLQISSGGGFSCGVHIDHRAFCWGTGDRGRVGDNSEPSLLLGPGQSYLEGYRSSPSPVFGNYLFAQLSSSMESTCGILHDGRAVCWGNGFAGGLGNGDETNRGIPTAVAGDFRFSRISHGSFGDTFAIRR
jgi:alpha-tubulin suppressor-like RCC1 family protein